MKLLPTPDIGEGVVGRAIAEGKANAGLGLEQAAAAFGLDFVFLTRERYGILLTVFALFVALVITFFSFFFARWIFEKIGKNGANIMSKIANLLLAAIAIMLIREGILLLLKGNS